MTSAIPDMRKVKSSNVDEIGYDGRTGELHVRFKTGGHYVYQGVTVAKHREMLAADSVGKYLADHIKPQHSVRKHDRDAAHA